MTGCGGGSSDPPQQQSAGQVSGNWQYTLAAASDGSYSGGLQGGFLVQDNSGSITGSANYAFLSPAATVPCNAGAGAITGNLNGSAVKLTVSAGNTSIQLNGTLSSDGTTMTGTYSLKAPNESQCGNSQTGLTWSAKAVPPLNGSFQGSLHNISGGLYSDNDSVVTGNITQGQNSGASAATLTGTISFPYNACLGTNASVNVTGTISGTSVILQMFSTKGLPIGQIGAPPNTSPPPSPVVFEQLSTGGMVLHGAGGFVLASGSCGSTGNICLALGNASDCTEPLSISPPNLTFPAQTVGSTPVTQTITITNTDPSGSALSGLTLGWNPAAGYSSPWSTPSDFNNQPNFTESDNCSTTPGGKFSLAPQQSCTVSVAFSPQQSCTWIPMAGFGGVAPAQCPPFVGSRVSVPPGLAASLTVNSPASADGDKKFGVYISGLGSSAIVPSLPELDYGSVAFAESSQAQPLTFTNQSDHPVQILPAATSPCVTPFPNPVHAGDIAGIRVVQGAGNTTAQGITATNAADGANSVAYSCDIDPSTSLANFQISGDTCTGRTLASQESCNLSVSYVPQPATFVQPGQGLDYFLQLTTQQCTGASSPAYCEIDSGRFPVELKVNPASPIRMTPGAGVNFGAVTKNTYSTPLTVKLYNDPKDPSSATVNFKGTVVHGDYTESDDCGASLAPGSSCTLSIVFSPQSAGWDPGFLTITYISAKSAGPQVQTIYMRGSGQ